MQVEVLRKNGEILFIETSSDFVAKLCRLLRDASVGSIAALTGAGAFSRLHESIAGMRQAVFALPKEEAIVSPLSIASLEHGNPPTYAPDVPFHLQVAGAAPGPWTLSGTSSGYGGTVFRSSGPTRGFTVHLKTPSANVYVGIVPETVQNGTFGSLVRQGVMLNLENGYVYVNGTHTSYWRQDQQ